MIYECVWGGGFDQVLHDSCDLSVIDVLTQMIIMIPKIDFDFKILWLLLVSV